MSKFWYAAIGLLVVWLGLPAAGMAQTSCTVVSQSTLLNNFADNVPQGSIVPSMLRNFVCSVPSLAGGGGGGSWTGPAVSAIDSTLLITGTTLGCNKATATQFGCVEPDNSTIIASGGVLTVIGGAATTITPGTTTIGGATAPCVIRNSGSTTMACDNNLGTPTTLVGTNITGTAAGLTAGNATLATAANGLKTASTTVVVSAATAPTSGQVLTATNSTTANWQTPSGGGGWTATAVSAINSTLTNTSGTLSCTTGTSGQLGCLKPDGTTITASAGTLTVVGGVATVITPGTTTVSGATAPCYLQNSTGTTLACPAAIPATAVSGSDRSSAVDPTIIASDMGNQINLTNSGSLTVVLPAKATGLWQPGQQLILASQGAGAVTLTNSTTLTAAGTCGSIAAGNAVLLTANNDTTHLDCQPLLGAASGAQITGTPTTGQLTDWADATHVQGITTGSGVVTALGNALSAAGGVTSTIAKGTATLGTSLIASGACATVVTATATNTATTDVLNASFNSDPTGVTGYAPSTSGILSIVAYPTTNTANFKVCNNTGSGITPGSAVTLNWQVVR